MTPVFHYPVYVAHDDVKQTQPSSLIMQAIIFPTMPLHR